MSVERVSGASTGALADVTEVCGLGSVEHAYQSQPGQTDGTDGRTAEEG